ncbi:MAG: BatD family protein, partial [Nitrospinales bacterium]
LFPTQAGPAEISSATVDLDLLIPEQARSPMNGYNFFFNDPFFGTTARNEHKTLKTKPIPMEVLALPKKDRPADFSGLVGQFEISAALGKKELEVGDTTTLTLTVTGAGNIQYAYLPPPKVKDSFKVYTDQPHLEKAIVNHKISGRKTFKFALVPLQEGEQVIPPIVLSYFDPEKRQYRTAKTKPIPVKILPSEVPEQIKAVDSTSLEQGFQPGEIKVIGKDILPIHDVLEDFEDQRPDHTAIYWACFVFPVLLFMCFSVYFKYQQRLREDTAYSRARRAYKIAREKLDQLSSAQPPKEFTQELSQILREYIGNKLNLQGTAFTSKEVESKLKEQRFAEGKVAFTRDLLEKFEAHQYGQNQNVAPDQLLEESLEVLKTLETKS